jgi:hypothetical protein
MFTQLLHSDLVESGGRGYYVMLALTICVRQIQENPSIPKSDLPLFCSLAWVPESCERKAADGRNVVLGYSNRRRVTIEDCVTPLKQGVTWVE